LVSELSKEYKNLQKAQDDLSQMLEEYMNYEKEQGQQLKEDSVPEDNQ